MCVSLLSDTSGAGSDEWCSSPASEEAVGSVCVWTRLFGQVSLSEVAMMVFVNQMLLMIAGDVEPNPGPGIMMNKTV